MAWLQSSFLLPSRGSYFVLPPFSFTDISQMLVFGEACDQNGDMVSKNNKSCHICNHHHHPCHHHHHHHHHCHHHHHNHHHHHHHHHLTSFFHPQINSNAPQPAAQMYCHHCTRTLAASTSMLGTTSCMQDYRQSHTFLCPTNMLFSIVPWCSVCIFLITLFFSKYLFSHFPIFLLLNLCTNAFFCPSSSLSFLSLLLLFCTYMSICYLIYLFCSKYCTLFLSSVYFPFSQR